jgi:hypothetical protein
LRALTHIRRVAAAGIAAAAITVAASGSVLAQPGTSLGIVTLPGNGECSVAGSFDGTYYITTFASSFGTGCTSSTLGIYSPPPTGAGPAVLVSTKTIVDGANNPVSVDVVDWDSSRNLLWGVHGASNGQAWLIDLGDKTMSGTATATLEFNYSIDGFELIDGLAWDFFDDTLWISPDVDCDVHHFSTTGADLGAIQPQNEDGDVDCEVSGVAIGANNTLYVSRDGTGEIRRVNKSNGSFVSAFTTTNFRVEDLTCDATTYAPKEAILAKDAFGSSYEAFEVEAGTCPQVPDEVGPPAALDLQPPTDTNDVGTQHCLTATVTDEDGDPVPGITVVFDVEGASEADANPPDEDGTAETDAEGVATFCYTGPDFPGADAIKAFADTDEDGMHDAPPLGDEPSDTATKTWVLPVSTPLCEVTITNGGRITAANGDRATFGGVAMADGEGDASGNEEYQDHGPVQPMNLHGTVLVVVCDEDETRATIFGTATVDGMGSFMYRLIVEDNGEPGVGTDKYWILVSNGYDSGNQTLRGGNVQIHQD